VPRAVGLTDELLTGWAPIIRDIRLVPSSKGRFEVTLDGTLIFSKAALGRHADAGEVAGLVEAVVGPRIDWE
jgi:selenoprotein W-related protein